MSESLLESYDHESLLTKERLIETDEPSALHSKFPPAPSMPWRVVGQSRTYVPSPADAGCCLRLSVAPVLPASSSSSSSDAEGSARPLLGPTARVETLPVAAPPAPPPPRTLAPADPLPHPTAAAGHPFRVMCFNVLAQIYTNGQMYPYCPVWAMEWNYRKHLLLREILSYDCEILCLQEVQADHYDQFFAPELASAGYEGVYKRKTRDILGDNQDEVDGCAIFFKRERFAMCEQYGIEFNEAARRHTADRKSLKRLLRGNIALVVVLEELVGEPPRRSANAGVGRIRAVADVGSPHSSFCMYMCMCMCMCVYV